MDSRRSLSRTLIRDGNDKHKNKIKIHYSTFIASTGQFCAAVS